MWQLRIRNTCHKGSCFQIERVEGKCKVLPEYVHESHWAALEKSMENVSGARALDVPTPHLPPALNLALGGSHCWQ